MDKDYLRNYIIDIRDNSWSRSNTPSVMARSIFYYILGAGSYLCKDNYFTERENYDRALIIYTTDGKGHLKYRGESYELTAGDLFIIDCNEYQYYASDNKQLWEMNWVHFKGSETNAYLEKIYQNGGPVYSASDDSKILENIKNIHKLLKNNDPSLDVLGSCLIVQILTELLMQSRHGIMKRNIPGEIDQIINIIKKDYNQPLTLDSLSTAVGISKYHMSREFKKYTGYSPYEYLINYRLSRGKDLLKSSDVSVASVATGVGFNSPSHFIKLFDQHEGTTPLKFRKYWR